jgi:primosomal protein N' (replication factor Y)
VLVQTFSPEHPAIAAALHHDYESFARQELPNRRALAYPPFASMIRLVVRGTSELATGEFAARLTENLQAAVEGLEIAARVLGPAPAPISKLRGKHRFQIQTQAADLDKLREAVRQATGDLPPSDDIQWTVDVDPLDMM